MEINIVTSRDKKLGNDAFSSGDFAEAVRIYTSALELDPSNIRYCAVIYCNRAAARMGQQKFGLAMGDCDEALLRQPTYARYEL